MNRDSMVDAIIENIIGIIEKERADGSAETLYDILINHIGFDFQTLREIVDKYNSIQREEA